MNRKRIPTIPIEQAMESNFSDGDDSSVDDELAPWQPPPKGTASSVLNYQSTIKNKSLLSSVNSSSLALTKYKSNQTLNKSQSTFSFLSSTYGIRQKQSCIEVLPADHIFFEDIEFGKLYTMTFSVRNTSTTANRIRINPPKTEYFSLNFISQSRIAAGLDTRGEIDVRIPAHSTLLEYQDYIEISMEGMNESIILPLIARKPVANIQFLNTNDPFSPIFDFNYVFPSQSVTKAFRLKNFGKIAGTINFPTTQNATWEPKSVTVHPGMTAKVNLTISELSTIGEWKESFEAEVSDSIARKMYYFVYANVTEPLVSLETINNQTVDKLDFGPLFYGQQKVIPLQLVNKSHKAVIFSVDKVIMVDEAVHADNGESLRASTATETTNLNSTCLANGVEKDMLFIEPPFGEYIVQPFSKTVVHAQFKPQRQRPATGFSRAYLPEIKKEIETRQDFSIQCKYVGDDQASTASAPVIQLPIQLCAKVSLPDVYITPTKLEFGKCAVFDRRDILIVLGNKSSSKAITFEFPTNIPQFRIKTPQIKLDPKETISIPITFLPHECGKFKSVIPVKIMNGIHYINLKVIGECHEISPNQKTISKYTVGGLDKLPNDFDRDLRLTSMIVNNITIQPNTNTFNSKMNTVLNKEYEKKLSNDLNSNANSLRPPSGYEEPPPPPMPARKYSFHMVPEPPKRAFGRRNSMVRHDMMYSGLKSSQNGKFGSRNDDDSDHLLTTYGGDLHGTVDTARWKVEKSDIDFFEKADPSSYQLDMSMPIMQRKLNEKKYNDFLASSFEERKLIYKMESMSRSISMSDYNDRSDPFGVDMGMERGLNEQDEPMPMTIKKVDVLNRMKSELKYLSSSGSLDWLDKTARTKLESSTTNNKRNEAIKTKYKNNTLTSVDKYATASTTGS